MLDLQTGIISDIAAGRAYVKLRGERAPLPAGMRYPKGQTPKAGDMALVAKVSGVYIIVAVY